MESPICRSPALVDGVGEKLHVIRQSPPFLAGVICIREDISEEDRISILDTLGSLHHEPEGEQLMMIMQIGRLIPFQPEYLEATSGLVKEYRKLQAARPRPKPSMPPRRADSGGSQSILLFSILWKGVLSRSRA